MRNLFHQLFLYRFRLLNGCNSRTLNLLMFTVDEQGNKLKEVPFYVVGGDQGLLPHVTMVTEGFSTALPGDGTFPPPASRPQPQRRHPGSRPVTHTSGSS